MRLDQLPRNAIENIGNYSSNQDLRNFRLVSREVEASTRRPTPRIEQLIPEVIQNITTHLDRASLGNLRPVSMEIERQTRSMTRPRLNHRYVMRSIQEFEGFVRNPLVNKQRVQSLKLDFQVRGHHLPLLENFPNLRRLDLSNNNPGNVGIGGGINNFPVMPHLETLDLSGNNIGGGIRNLPVMPHLQTLDLSGNNIGGGIRNLPVMPHLQTLNLSGNNIGGGIRNLPVMPHLQTLDARQNNITALDIGGIFNNMPHVMLARI